MKISYDSVTEKKAKEIIRKVIEFGIGQKNIKNDFIDKIPIKVIEIPKTKQKKFLETFGSEIKEGCPAKWIECLGITHYWKEKDVVEEKPIGSHWLDQFVTWTKIEY